MRHREEYSTLGTIIGLAMIAATIGAAGIVLLLLLRGVQWLIGAISGFLV